MVIVLVDSNTSYLNQLTSAIKNHDRENTVVTYRNAADALEYVKTHPVNMVISEVTMVGMDGYTFSIRVRDLRRGIHIVLMSEDRNKAMHAWNDRANYFLTKPFTTLDVEECFKD